MTHQDLQRRLAELEAENARLKQPRPVGRTVKRNKNGGLFIRDAKFRDYSPRTGKSYIAGLNISPWTAVHALFTDEALLAEVVAFVAAEGPEVVTADEGQSPAISNDANLTGLAARIASK